MSKCLYRENLKALSHGEFQTWKYPHANKLRLSKSQGASTPAEFEAHAQNCFLCLDCGLYYLRVSCYTDVGYLTDADDLKSQTGYVFVLNGGAVDWKSASKLFATSICRVGILLPLML
ncbi:hypothetical protein Tco_0850519 [Tanacetum coccineum]